jgi:hypothetical protein
MSDPLRTGSSAPADALQGLERDARVEQLLLHGLDQYFAGEYENAVHVWTRVLFLDRGHARARAYIERARSAQAERQRKSEELLHRGVAAFDRGDAGDARALLTEAVSQGAPAEVALSYLGRLDRLQSARRVPDAPRATRVIARPTIGPPAMPQPRRTPRALTLTAAGMVLAAVGIWAALVFFELTDLRSALQLRPPAALQVSDDPVPVPRTTELALARARTQYAAGRVGDALRTLATIGPSDPVQAEADRLRAEIQRVLLASAPVAPLSAASVQEP